MFERLFGEGESADGRRAALRTRASLLDSFSDDIARLKRRVGTTDRVRVDQYLDTIREIERQIQRAERERPAIRRPTLIGRWASRPRSPTMRS